MSAVAVTAGVLVAVVVRLVCGPRRRGADALGIGGDGVGGVGGGGAVAGRPGARGSVTSGRVASRRAAGRPAGPRGATVGAPAVVVAQVAALLRSGLPPAAAWAQATGARCDTSGVPDARDLAAASAASGRQVAGVVAAARLAAVLGAPLASVLDDVGAAMTASDEARSEREAALAGPRTTARVLAWMPVAGVGFGYALGADPVGVLVGGGAGTTAGVLAVGLVAVGRRWTTRLTVAAREAGEPR